jgi:hypothetical protein
MYFETFFSPRRRKDAIKINKKDFAPSRLRGEKNNNDATNLMKKDLAP